MTKICVICGVEFSGITNGRLNTKRTCDFKCRTKLQLITMGGRGSRFKHGYTGERLHNIWRDMHKRCKSVRGYFDRGITVCDEWFDYVAFRKWAMSNGYSDLLTIDRIDNDSNYCAKNCQWITMAAQSRNRRTSRVIEFKNEEKCLAEWAEIAGISQGLLGMRIGKMGWSMDKAMSTPVQKYNKLVQKG